MATPPPYRTYVRYSNLPEDLHRPIGLTVVTEWPMAARELPFKGAREHAEERAMRSHPTPTEPDLAEHDLSLADGFDIDGDSTSSGFILFSLGPAQPDA